MGKLVMIILTKSSKFSAKCVAGINVENGEWERLVSDDVEKQGAIPDYKLQTDTREVCILDVVEVPIIGRCGDLLQPENVMIDKTEKMKIIDRVTLQDVLKIHPKENGDYKYILGNPYMYVSEDTINDVHRSLTLVKVKNLIIRQVVTPEQKKKTKACFFYRGDYYENIPVTDPDFYNVLDNSFCKSAYLVVSIGTPYNNKYYKFVAKIFVTEDD